MNVLYISFNNPRNSGVNTIRVFDVLNYFAKKKIKVTHLTPYRSFDIKGVKNIVVKDPQNIQPNLWSQFARPILSLNEQPQVNHWIPIAKKYLLRHYQALGPFDVIYINTHPVSIVEVGILAKQLFQAKLVVDFQDAYFYNPYKINLPILDPWFKAREQFYLQQTDLLIVSTPSAEKIYRRNYSRLHIQCVTNMIPSTLPKIKTLSSIKQSVTPAIVYGGSLNVGRDLFPILKALPKANRNFKIEVLGQVSVANKLRYLKYSTINWLSPLFQTEYYQFIQNKMDIGVVLQNFQTRQTGISCIAAKTYEYLALNKPVIYIGPAGDNADIIQKYSNNCCVITDPDQVDKIVKFLTNFTNRKNNTKASFYKSYSLETNGAKIYALLQSLQ